MLDKMDELTKNDPAFHVNAQELVKRSESDCVSTTELILNAGGIDSSSRTPTGVWEDLYGNFSDDDRLSTENPYTSQGMFSPESGSLYGRSSANQRLKVLDNIINQADEQQRKDSEDKKRQAEDDGGR